MIKDLEKISFSQDDFNNFVEGMIMSIWYDVKDEFPPIFGVFYGTGENTKFALTEMDLNGGSVDKFSELAVDVNTKGWFMVFSSVPKDGDPMISSGIIDNDLVGRSIVVSISGSPSLEKKIMIKTYENVFGNLKKIHDGEIDQNRVEFLNIKNLSGMN